MEHQLLLQSLFKKKNIILYCNRLLIFIPINSSPYGSGNVATIFPCFNSINLINILFFQQLLPSYFQLDLQEVEI